MSLLFDEPLIAGLDYREEFISAAEERELLGRLTDREREVALAVSEGDSNAQIGARLGLSLPTVKAHVSRLLTKLEASNRVQIALLVHDAG